MSYTTAARHPRDPQVCADLYGRRIAARLDEATHALPHDISERLRAARVRAVAQRKREVLVMQPQLAIAGGAGLFEGRGGDGRQAPEGQPGFWRWVVSALPVVVLAAGLVAIQSYHADQRASEVAEVDAALLTDDLPPAAYADAGFVQFLKSDR